MKAFGLSVFLAGFIPFGVSSFAYTRWFHTVIIEPHWFGFSSIGFFILLAAGVLFAKKIMAEKAWKTTASILILGLAIWTRTGNSVWADEETYCRYWLKVNPTDVTAQKGMASAYIRKHDKGLNKEGYKDAAEVLPLIEAFKVLQEDARAQQYREMFSP